MSVTDLWDQPRIAAEFGIASNTVQSTWRHASLRALREHLDTALALPQHTRHAGQVRDELGDLRHVTRSRFEEVRARYGLPRLTMPRAALPLPDITIGSKPAWKEQTMQRWADGTGRRAEDGGLRRSSPPGRPVGIVETAPRQRRAEAAVAGLIG